MAGDLGAAGPPKSAGWSQLTEQQRQVLAPLEEDWNALSSDRKRKWLGVAQRYPKMKAAEQERVQQRMRDWMQLSPEQRRNARENYRTIDRSIGKNDAGKRTDLAQRWTEYQALPEEDRQNLIAPPSPPATEQKVRRSRAKAP